MAAVTVVMSGEDAKLRQAHERLLKGLQKLTDAYDKAEQQSKKSADQAQREAQHKKAVAEQERRVSEARKRGVQITQQSLTPQERFNRQMAEVQKLFREGHISLETSVRSMRKYRAELEQATASGTKMEKSQKGIFDSFESKVVGMVAGYASIQGAISAVNNELQKEIDLRKENSEVVDSIGAATQESLKNLTGLTREQKKAAITEAGEIGRRTGFSDVSQLISAVGTGFSASGDIKATLKAVEAAAKLTVNRPDTVAAITSSTLDVARALKIPDMERALGFVLSAGATARVEDPAKLARALAPVLQAGSNLAPNQDALEAGRDAAALFGVLSRFATDFKGESTTTAGITLLQQMQKFFDDIPNQQLELQGKLSKAKDDQEKSSIQKELKQLQALKDPGTIRGRFAALSRSPLLKNFFSEEFGERRFQAAFKKLFSEADEASIEMAASRRAIVASRRAYEQNVEEINELNAVMAAATSGAAGRGQRQQQQIRPLDSFNTEILTGVASSLSQNKFSGVTTRGFLKNLEFAFRDWIGEDARQATGGLLYPLSTGDPVTTAIGGFGALRQRRYELNTAMVQGAIDTDAQLPRKVQDLNAAMEQIINTVETMRKVSDELTADQQRRADEFLDYARAEIDNAAARAAAGLAGAGAGL